MRTICLHISQAHVNYESRSRVHSWVISNCKWKTYCFVNNWMNGTRYAYGCNDWSVTMWNNSLAVINTHCCRFYSTNRVTRLIKTSLSTFTIGERKKWMFCERLLIKEDKWNGVNKIWSLWIRVYIVIKRGYVLVIQCAC